MEKFETVKSKVVPLPMKDIDTDMIIPAQYLTSISREGYDQHLFRRLRDQDPEFPLNQPIYNGAKILVAESNFGCGSSREHAVWALMGYGFRAVIAKSFADIFTGNSSKNGLVLVVLPEKEIDKLLKQAVDKELEVTVDLENQQVTLPDGRTLAFDYDPFRKHCILNGLDDIDYILSAKDEVTRFRAQQEDIRFMSTADAMKAR